MGVKGFSSNKRKNVKRDKTNKWHRAVKAERKKQIPVKQLDIEDIHLYSKEKLRNKLKNPQNNIKISGKKRRRLTKRLGHALKEKSRMEVEVEVTPRQKTIVQHDAVMTNEDAAKSKEEHTMDTDAATALPSGSAKKKRRGRKRNKSNATSHATSGTDGKDDDGWEDVQMEDDW